MLPATLVVFVAFFVSTSGGPAPAPIRPDESKATLITTPQPPPGTGQVPQDIGEPGATIAGKVTIGLNRQTLAEGETISAIVANGLSEIIYAEDRKSDCSILFLERWREDHFELLSGCMQRRPATWIAIGSGRVRKVIIEPRSMNMRQIFGMADMGFGQGLYRLTLIFRLERVSSSTPIMVRSRLFDIAR